MRRTPLLVALGLAAVLAGGALTQIARAATPAASRADAATIERGRYLVEGVGMCIDCHSPRLQTGEYDRSRWLMGAPLPFAPTVPMPAWAPAAPSIAGLENYTDEEAVKLLMTGMTPLDSALRPPMPEYRMNAEDAAAVVAYLRSQPIAR
jgi:mono/diheme cytochrome c family protein